MLSPVLTSMVGKKIGNSAKDKDLEVSRLITLSYLSGRPFSR